MTESIYFKVLEAQKKKVKDYEEVHFRRSAAPDGNASTTCRDPSSIVLNPKKVPRQSVVFSVEQAPLFFRCTEDFWFFPYYSRFDASKHLFDLPTGSFVVRNSDKARYAITVRLSGNDPPVNHFLIQNNEQGLLTIQGSNLQFLSLYDLLSFFCFNQSGGMPCRLRPPDGTQPPMEDLNESSDSNAEDDSNESAATLDSEESTLKGSVSNEGKSARDCDLIDMLLDHCKDEAVVSNVPKPFNSPPPKHKPPPKPPRHDLSERGLTDNQKAQIKKAVKRLSGLVEVDVDDLFESRPGVLGCKVSDLIQKFDLKNVTPLKTKSPCNDQVIGFTNTKVIPTPPLPPRPLLPILEAPPTIPPRTPAPLIPPKPAGSCPPKLPQKPPSTPIESPSVPPRPSHLHSSSSVSPRPSRLHSSSQTGVLQNSVSLAVVERSDVEAGPNETTPTLKEPSVKTAATRSKAKASIWAMKLHWPKKPHKRIRKYILDLSSDQNQEFGKRVAAHIAGVKQSSCDPHQQLLSEIRCFMTEMRELLLHDYNSDLVQCGKDQCPNFEHVIETALQHCIVKPLSSLLYQQLEVYFTGNGSTAILKNSMQSSLMKSSDEMGIRKHLILPNNKIIGEIGLVFSRMSKTYCAISKLEYLLEAVRLIYENVRDSKHPKKLLTDLGADDFLPLFVWVLAQCQFYRAEIEAEYMWGLAHPSLFKGEGGYYLTTLTSAVNVLKETQNMVLQPSQQVHPTMVQLPCMNNLQTELKVYFEDYNTGQFSSAFYLQVVPTMTAVEICEVIAQRHRIGNPQDYALFTIINGQAKRMEDHECPQEIKMRWTLDRSAPLNQTKPVTKLITYRKVSQLSGAMRVK